MTFVTPTLLAGDRSLTNVVAHEIAHSWTGNLVTNRNWESFWLNEVGGVHLMVMILIISDSVPRQVMRSRPAGNLVTNRNWESFWLNQVGGLHPLVLLTKKATDSRWVVGSHTAGLAAWLQTAIGSRSAPHTRPSALTSVSTVLAPHPRPSAMITAPTAIAPDAQSHALTIAYNSLAHAHARGARAVKAIVSALGRVWGARIQLL